MDQTEPIKASAENPAEMDDVDNPNERQSLIRRSKRILGDDVQLGEARAKRGRARRGKLVFAATHLFNFERDTATLVFFSFLKWG